MRSTPEQRAAIADRGRSSLLAAGAGSGKTAVMVERFAEAVPARRRRRRLDPDADVHREGGGRAARADPAAVRRARRARARARGRRRLDRHDPRLLRARAAQPAARRGPGPALHGARRGGRAPARDRPRSRPRWRTWTAAHGAPAVDLAAAYGRELEPMIDARARRRCAAAARRIRGCAIPPAAPAPDPAPLAAAAAARRRGAARRARQRRARRPRRSRRWRRASGSSPAGEPPLPGALDAAKLPAGAKALEHDDCVAYRDAWEAYRAACADHHARPALVLLDALLDAFGTAYAAGQDRPRAGVDFDDLELRVRDLLAGDPALRAGWAERFALIMVDEFQDTNRLQLDVLEALERGNLFAVGDESQSIYGFRHADVGIFRARRAALGADGVRSLTVNFRSRPEILDVVNAAFAPLLGRRLHAARRRPRARGAAPVRARPARGAARRAARLRDRGLGGARGRARPRRRSRRSPGAAPRRARSRRGCAPRSTPAAPQRDVVVLVRATSSLRLYEQALEEQGLQHVRRRRPRLLGAGAGPRRHRVPRAAGEPARRGVALRRRSPRRSAARTPTRWSCSPRRAGARGTGPGPRCGGAAAGRPGSLLARASCPRRRGRRLAAFARFAAGERLRAERLPVEVLLERAIAATGYDLAILARAGGDRRLANLRKLMRLAREYERAEGRDLRGFLAYAVGQDLAEAREGEAALESEGLDAVRLMTIHRAKGLEFPVVCVADLGRTGATGREPAADRRRRDRRPQARDARGRRPGAGARLRPDRRGARRGRGGRGAPAALRRRDARRGAADPLRRRRHREVAARRGPARPPLDWLAPALLGVRGRCPAEAVVPLRRRRRRRPARHRREPPGRGGRARRRATAPPAPGTALPAEPKVIPAWGRPQPAQRRLSYSSLQDYARCGYRFYLTRVLGPAAGRAAGRRARRGGGGRRRAGGRARAARGPHPRLARPPAARAARLRPPGAARRRGRASRWARRTASSSSRAHVEDIRAQVAAFAASPLCARLARRARRPPRGGLRVRARARRGRPAPHRLRRRARARAATARSSSSTTRPTGSTRTRSPRR